MEIPLSDISDESVVNPVNNGVLDETERMQKILGMRTPLLFQSGHRLDDTRLRELDRTDSKITQYSLSSLRVYRALFIGSRTFLTQWETWTHLCWLTVISIVAMGLTWLRPEGLKSTPIELLDSELLSRIQTLLSFVIVSYIGLCMGRWNDMCGKMGKLWGGLEAFCFFSYQFLREEKDEALRNTILRYSRLTFLLLFYAAQNNENYVQITTPEGKGGLGLLYPKEEVLLKAAPYGVRPLISLGWLFGILGELVDRRGAKSGGERSAVDQVMVLSEIQRLYESCRGGICQCLGKRGTPIPLMYTHLVFWVVQALLVFMAISTGVYLAVSWERRGNGNDGYSYDDGSPYPKNKAIWYANVWAFRVIGNVMFALFVEGLLKVCELLENPFRSDKFGLPSFMYEVYLHNNVKGIAAGQRTYHDVLKEIHPDAFGLTGCSAYRT